MAREVNATGRTPVNELNAANSVLNDLQPALQRLDTMLQAAVAAARLAYGPEAAADPYRGLYTGLGEVEKLLARQPGIPVLQNAAPELPLSESLGEQCRLKRLARAFQLSLFDLDLILVALAPELDLRYERLYAYLQDDVTRRRPSADLAFNLLCTSAEDKLARRRHLAATAPLTRHGLLSLLVDPQQVRPPLLAQYLKLDGQIISYLLAEDTLDARLTSFCQWAEPAATLAELPVGAELQQALPGLAMQARERRRSLRLHFQGPRGIGKRRVAEALAHLLEAPLLVADLARAPAAVEEFEAALTALLHAALLQEAVLYCTGIDVLLDERRIREHHELLARIERHQGMVILAGSQAWRRADANLAMQVVPFPALDSCERQTYLQRCLAASGVALAAAELDALAGRLQLTPEQISGTVADAVNLALWRATRTATGSDKAGNSQPTLAEFFTAARGQSDHHLRDLARKITPRYTWDDLVLPADELAQLHEICQQAKQRHIVYEQWGFGRKLALGKGLNVLFSGPPGTGKTMAGDVIANELSLTLYKIDLSQVVSKYIGETEKNLERIFTAAQNTNAILFFDEADALFGKRSEVRDAHDRYANIEVGYLLQKMEEYEGVAILATNLRAHMDDAFVRRMHAIVEFQFPDEMLRRRIWEVVFPREAPLAEDVDFAVLAREVKLAGGNIRNIALTAAFYAADAGETIGMSHLLRAARREHQKIGRTWNDVK
ncbi:MAG: ATP-binding protein [Candidatus Accumulibacter sp.]|nr:ATP-binding protein [Accumulibacter sp.]